MNLVSAYSIQGDYAKMIEYSEHTTSIWEEVYGPAHPYIAMTYSNLGGVYETTGELEKARRSYQKSLELLEGQEEYIESIVIVLEGLGYTEEKAGNYEEAIRYFNQGIKLITDKYGDSHRLLAKLYSDLDHVWNQTR